MQNFPPIRAKGQLVDDKLKSSNYSLNYNIKKFFFFCICWVLLGTIVFSRLEIDEERLPMIQKEIDSLKAKLVLNDTTWKEIEKVIQGVSFQYGSVR